jgi:hypothetical protein
LRLSGDPRVGLTCGPPQRQHRVCRPDHGVPSATTKDQLKAMPIRCRPEPDRRSDSQTGR